ncbi:hypothetical protein HRR83_001747 [Exophiala dermatitidis]|nr:hypothetical protein HRR76_007199 [Exophiala dermatitidis]KAJ4546238.1 hypothetical protein HRR77_004772 [Exophiala dermatitidis]KAJ4567517.1 hypothetical protein HRR79_005033 [Exophiala dermatitidis]KAJ4594659.1 hypothetical protein HRR84_005933 [Exophiala dermatitidis]KAJ4605778.1 hypothetical protein HRR83_001747 [Exophiala dermatitidis]
MIEASSRSGNSRQMCSLARWVSCPVALQLSCAFKPQSPSIYNLNVQFPLPTAGCRRDFTDLSMTASDETSTSGSQNLEAPPGQGCFRRPKILSVSSQRATPATAPLLFGSTFCTTSVELHYLQKLLHMFARVELFSAHHNRPITTLGRLGIALNMHS